MATKLDLDCYLFDTWRPRIRPASRRRDWMDATPESFAYRCLPLAIANACGWEIGGGVGFAARWRGGSGIEDVEIVLDGACEPIDAPISLFGQGTITFHIAGLFRTSPGWNLWVGGPPNYAKDGIAALSGIIETDWSPYSFTMNWRFTRPNHWVRFEADEAICFFLPIERGVVEAVQPRFRPISEAPELERQFRTWSRSRDAFQAQVKADPPALPADKWQKLYYRGVDPDGAPGVRDHQSKIRARPFTPALPEIAPASGCPVRAAPVPDPPAAGAERLLDRLHALRALSPRLRVIERLRSISPERFLDDHYASNWPVILASGIAAAPEAERRIHKLLARVGRPSAGYAPVEDEGGAGACRDAIIPIADLLDQDGEGRSHARLLCGGAQAFSPLAEETRNRLLAQVAGRSRIVLAPPAAAARLRQIGLSDLLDPAAIARVTGTTNMALFNIVLAPGETLFLPIGWWTQIRALDPSILFVTTGFRWRNDFGDD